MSGEEGVRQLILSRSLEENLAFIERDEEEPFLYHIRIGFVPNMRVPGGQWVEFINLFPFCFVTVHTSICRSPGECS